VEITPRHWLIALLIAGLTHAALALALVQMAAPPAIVPAGITIEIGDGGASGASGALDAAGEDGSSGSADSAVIQPVASPAPGVRVSTETSEDQAQEPLNEEVTHEQSATLQPVTEVETLIAKTLPEPEPKQRPQPKPEPEPAAAPKPAPESTSAPVPTPSRVKPKLEPKPRTTPARPIVSDTEAKPERPTNDAIRGRSKIGAGDVDQANAGATVGLEMAGNRSDGRGSGGSGSGNRGSGGSDDQASTSNYYGRLATWLARHKRYPTQARRLRQEGTVKVTFTILRSGRVVSKRIVQSSGYALLDDEVQAMLERASPLPRIPSSLDRSSLTITLPVAFSLR
jgi:protein TonB